MEKIGFPPASAFHLKPEKQGKNKKSKTGKTSKTFLSVLDGQKDIAEPGVLSASSLEEEGKLEEILDHLYQLGESLKSEQTISNLKKYRESIKNFFKYVVNNGIEAEKVTGVRNPRTMEQKQYTLIRMVDGKLEKLAAYIISSQRNQIDILKGVDEIYGLLINLTS